MKLLLLLPFIIFFTACQDKQELNSAAPMHWDRDMCDRCVMVISDRKNSVQLRGKVKKQVHKFDDIGCMVIWLEENKIDTDNLNIWVTDVVTGEWIDAKSATYTSGNTTPMAYGFSAYKNNTDTTKPVMSFYDVYKTIKE